MAALLIIGGLVLVLAAIRNTLGSLAGHFKQDLSGGPNGSFAVWVAAFVVIGAVGYIPKMAGISRAMLALIIIVLALKNGTGFMQSFISQITNIPAETPSQPAAPANLGPAQVQITNPPSGAGGILGALSGGLFGGGSSAGGGITSAANLAGTAGL